MSDKAAREKRLEAALTEVMDWIKNWNPNFTYDDEWPDTRARAEQALQNV